MVPPERKKKIKYDVGSFRVATEAEAGPAGSGFPTYVHLSPHLALSKARTAWSATTGIPVIICGSHSHM